MRLKGINPVEQHVEKIVLGVVGAVFLGVVAMQFLVSPNEVEYEGQPVAPDRVLTRLGDKADGVLGQMTDPSPDLPSVTTPVLAERFEEAFARPVVPVERIASTPLGDGFEIEIAEVESLDGPVTPLQLAAPATAMAASQWSTVDPFFKRANPAMDEYLPVAQPLDTPSVTIETVIDGTAIASALRESAEGRRAIPSHWYSSGGSGLIEVLETQMERQLRLPDGSWAAPEPVEQVRWTATPMQALNEGVPTEQAVTWETLRPADLQELARLAQSDPSLVAQPPYLPTIAGVEWVPPSKIDERRARLEVQANIGRVEQQIAELEQDIQDLEDRQAGRASRDQQRRSDPAGGGGGARRSGGGGGGGFVVGGGGGGGSRSGATTQRDDPIAAQISRKNEQIAELETELDTLYTQLEEQGGQAGTTRSARRPARPTGRPGATDPTAPLILGGDPGGGRRVFGGGGTTTRRTTTARTAGAESPGPLLEVAEYRVWGHDLTAEPGETYRYRVRYGVNNPLFGRERSLGSEDESLVALAKQPLVMSPWTEWSEPVAVGREEYFFVTSARDRGVLGQGSASATAEIYKMFYGYYRKHTVSLEPGMAVHGRFTLPENLPEFRDVRGITSDALMAYFDEREAAETPRDDPDAEPVDRPWLSFFDPTPELPINVVMLDVADYPLTEQAGLEGARARRLFEVYFFDPRSGVVARRPDQDREMAEYATVEQSSRLAETAEIRRPDPQYVP